MKLFFDEDTGKGVPKALRALRVHGLVVDYVGGGTIPRGAPDEVWLPYVGQQGFLVISCNRGILMAEAQRGLLISERVGAVFLRSGEERKLNVLKLILNQWEWLQSIDIDEPRPFAYLITIAGRKARVRL